MARKASLSGFPEHLPAERLVENFVLDTLRETFELHGFSSIETRSVETVEQLLRKGEIDKEVYAVSRLQEDESERGKKEKLALHFDLTVPFARYVVENAGYLNFPFMRYQIQKVWRGERPQEGRAREFTQADVDVVGDGVLPFRYDVELALVMVDALSKLPIPEFKLRINNRKLSEGFYKGIGLEDTAGVLRSIDKIDKIGSDAVAQLLKDELGASDEQAQAAIKLAQIKTEDTSFVEQVRALGVNHELLEEGLTELSEVISETAKRAPGRVRADLSIARGLDYYTGTVYETVLVGHEQLGSICSGGRYESLASNGKRTYPGVGLSIGVTRVVARILSQNLAEASRGVPSAVFIALTNDEMWSAAQDVADALRTRKIACEVSATAAKFGKQIKYAEKRGIPFVWFINEKEGQLVHEVKDIRTGEQVEADPTAWMPPAEDLQVRVRPVVAE
ncbi:MULTISPECIES: histidine--tRNA ligase [unclassified Rothia (in: high G+C Gram-positive bacteria)]|uniref:histidine--tRNA ligase n=1 Tax=unclassified Rothia (in: high G+C Gram-positive bacteria) TaxID=2689056 RepID=UPI001957B78B|nr:MULTISPECIES: histidine--tRNA ligase [unclassified Rothia (in: high G+C Gram-positive bacteria)]MBM7050482.1 histidine--tRNA ligase [Rothia sp. ZJ1223]QRZ62459.1 histidine--tRNA ligase [Rothia sp. ZJ932]